MQDVLLFFSVVEANGERRLVAYAYTLESRKRYRYKMSKHHMERSSAHLKALYPDHRIIHITTFIGFMQVYSDYHEISSDIWVSSLGSMRRNLEEHHERNSR